MITEHLFFLSSNDSIAMLDWEPLFDDRGIPLAIMGLIVVFAALLLVCAFIGLLPRIMAALDRLHPEVHEAPPVPKPAPTVQQPEELTPEILAVISAVVAHTVRKPHRIVHTKELSSEDMNWVAEGRRQHHASHKIQRRDQG